MSKNDFKIEVHHIGGRDGEMGEFPLNKGFLDDIVFHIYDPDPSCLPQIAAISESRGLKYRLHPYIVTDEVGETEFSLNHCACTSSLLPAAKFKANQYSPLFLMGDYRYLDAFKPIRTINVPSITLDVLAEREKLGVDFLSIDTQGSEGRVLVGASNLLSSSVIGVLSEVELHELYEGQPLFGDIHQMMRNAGFNFMCFFTREARVNFFRAGIGFRGDGMLMSADALFLRDPDRVEHECANPRSAMLKLAFVAISFGYVEYCLDCLSRVFANDESTLAPTAELPAYVGFLNEVWRAYQGNPFIPQPSFAELFTAEEALRRFEPDNPHAWSTFDRDRVLRKYFAGLDIEAFRRSMPALLEDSDSTFEALLRRYDMSAVADVVKEKRIKHASMVVESLRLGEKRGRSYHLVIDDELRRLGIEFDESTDLTADEIRAEAERLSRMSGWKGGPSEGWQYPFDLGHGIVTKTYTEVQAELHPWRKQVLLDNLTTVFAGRFGEISVLDLGSCEGSMALALWERGVRDITCVEGRSLNVEKARFVFNVRKANIPVVEDNVINFLSHDNRKYDLVLFMGLLYHLLDPFQVLRLVAERVRSHIVVETVLAKPHDLRFENVPHYSPSPAGFFIRHDSARCNTAGLSDLELWPDRNALETVLSETGFSRLREMDYGSNPISWYETGQRIMIIASK